MLWFHPSMDLEHLIHQSFFAQAFNASYFFALLMGMFSSLHCLGMCGSIIGSLTLGLPKAIQANKARLVPFVLCYNLGRITSYAVAGLFAGLVGSVIAFPFEAGQGYRVMQGLSALFMAAAGLYIAGWFPRFAYVEKAGALIWRKIGPYGRRLMPVRSLPKAFGFGMVWGWLPCGLVYAALGLAATTGDVVRSTFAMLSFGVGTLPAVVGVGIMTNWMVRLSHLRYFRQCAGIIFLALAVLAAFPWINPMFIGN